MFYYLTLSKSIDVHPKFFGPQLRAVIETTVKTKVEGVCLGKHGYCVCVTRLRDVGQGLIRPDGTGLATFDVRYDCIMFRPFRGQILDVTVREVFSTGFIAEAGPVQIFVGSHCIPESFAFVPDNDGAFESVEKEMRIVAGTDIRLKILNLNVEPSEIVCVGTFNERGLGMPTV